MIKKKDIEKEEELTFARLHNEPELAYKYFCVYRDLGDERSLQKVADLMNVSYPTVSLHSFKFHWRERIRLWADEVDRQRRDAYLHEIKEMAKRHAKESMMFQKVLMMPVDAIFKRIEENDQSYQDFQNLPVDVLFDKSLKSAALLSSVIDIERKSKGEPTEILRQEIEATQTHDIRVVLPQMPNHLSNVLKSDNNEEDDSQDN